MKIYNTHISIGIILLVWEKFPLKSEYVLIQLTYLNGIIYNDWCCKMSIKLF